VVAVERDRRFVPALEELQQNFPGKLEIIEADALRVDEQELAGSGARVVSNLPYNVGTALFLRWLTTAWPPWWRSLTLMFQKEVAERIVAAPGTSAYGRLSVLAQWRCDCRIAMRLSRSAFVPPPKVASAVVHVIPNQAPAGVEPKCLERVTEAAFGQRRKMLRSSLKALPQALGALTQLGIDSERRAETLSVAEFVEIARLLSRT
jgi:16S rRNA (adenine1518-N6/adenine1519-N6)-dimethyltransferase